MRLIRKSLFFLAASLLTVTLVQAQKESAWTYEAPARINWQQVTPLGNLVINTNEALIGIDAPGAAEAVA